MSAPVRLKATLLILLVAAAAGSYVFLDIGALTGDRSAGPPPATPQTHTVPTPATTNTPQLPPGDTAPNPLPVPFPIPETTTDTEAPMEQEKTDPTSSPKEREQQTDGTGLRGSSTR
ncbi:hypothetical protein ACFW9U_23390 [Rhodococcus aetherivorans]|uniref:hypothetical protein n=1 Tax=Rhodococcus aetherivorans TaxID=191292 RepID=UPI00366B20BB